MQFRYIATVFASLTLTGVLADPSARPVADLEEAALAARLDARSGGDPPSLECHWDVTCAECHGVYDANLGGTFCSSGPQAGCPCDRGDGERAAAPAAQLKARADQSFGCIRDMRCKDCAGVYVSDRGGTFCSAGPQRGCPCGPAAQLEARNAESLSHCYYAIKCPACGGTYDQDRKRSFCTLPPNIGCECHYDIDKGEAASVPPAALEPRAAQLQVHHSPPRNCGYKPQCAVCGGKYDPTSKSSHCTIGPQAGCPCFNHDEDARLKTRSPPRDCGYEPECADRDCAGQYDPDRQASFCSSGTQAGCRCDDETGDEGNGGPPGSSDGPGGPTGRDIPPFRREALSPSGCRHAKDCVDPNCAGQYDPVRKGSYCSSGTQAGCACHYGDAELKTRNEHSLRCIFGNDCDFCGGKYDPVSKTSRCTTGPQAGCPCLNHDEDGARLKIRNEYNYGCIYGNDCDFCGGKYDPVSKSSRCTIGPQAGCPCLEHDEDGDGGHGRDGSGFALKARTDWNWQCYYGIKCNDCAGTYDSKAHLSYCTKPVNYGCSCIPDNGGDEPHLKL